MGIKVAIIGATGAVGRIMQEELTESPLRDLSVGLFASARSAGQQFKFRGQNLTVQEYSLGALKGYDCILMSAGGAFSKQNSPQLADQGSIVIDNSSAFRKDLQYPLIVPEINMDTYDIQSKKPTIIANPNCSTIPLVMTVDAIRKAYDVRSINVSTYQSVSGW